MFTVSVKCNCTRGATSSATFYHYVEGHSFSLDHVTCGGLAGSSAICFAASISTSLRETNDPVLGRGTADYEGKSVEKRVETITRFLHDFANFNGRRKKKKKASILSSEEIVSEIKPSIYDCDFLQYTQQIERQFSLEN